MRSVALVALIVLTSSLLSGAAHKPQLLWPGGAPGEKATTEPEKDATTAKDNKPAGRLVTRLGNVTEPAMTFYPAPSSNNTHAAVLVFPGGGYRILAYDLEGTEVCQWLNSIGINAILVKYRVPQPQEIERYKQPLQDAQRAMGLVRSRAKKMSIDPQKIGILGFSAGGHLSAVLGNGPEERIYTKIDAADDISAHPNFVLLVYPAYLSVKDHGSELAPEVKPSNTPPTFIVQAEDDKNFIAGTLLYYRSLRDAHIPAELHVYAKGGHGYGMRPTENPVTHWSTLAGFWLKSVIASTPSTATPSTATSSE